MSLLLLFNDTDGPVSGQVGAPAPFPHLATLFEPNNLTLSIDAGALTLAGQSLTLNTGVSVSTAGALTLAGQSLTLGSGLALGTGALTLSGETLTVSLGGNLFLAVDHGALTLTGQSLAITRGLALDAGALSIGGQSASFSLGLSLTQGALGIAGQDLTLDLASGGGSENPAPLPIWSGILQPSNNLFLALDPGTASIAGQSVAFNRNVALSTAGTLTLTGHDLTIGTIAGIGSANPAPLPIWSGILQPTSNLSLQIDAGSLSLSGQDLTIGLSNPERPALPEWLLELPGAYFAEQFHASGRWSEWQQNVALRNDLGGDLQLPLDTAGVLTLTGQAIGVSRTLPLTAGALALAGQSLGFGQNLALTAGALTLTGQDLALVSTGALTLSIQAGALTLTGQSLAMSLSLAVAQGALTLAGQSLTISSDVALGAGALSLAGQGLDFSVAGHIGLGIEPGTISLSGHTLNLEIQVPLDPGQIILSGQNLTLERSGSVAIDLQAGAIGIAGQTLSVELSGLILDALRQRFTARSDPEFFAVMADGESFKARHDPTEFST